VWGLGFEIVPAVFVAIGLLELSRKLLVVLRLLGVFKCFRVEGLGFRVEDLGFGL